MPLTLVALFVLGCGGDTEPPLRAAALGLTTQPPASAQSGVVLAEAPVVGLRDADGVPVAQAGVQISVAIASGDGTLGGTTTRATDASGQAAFSDLTVNGTVGPRTLVFSATGLPDVTSNTIDLAAGPAAILQATSPAAVIGTVNTAVPTLPSVIAKDASGNPVAGVALTFAAGATAGTLTGTTPTTDASGMAALESWTLPTLAGRYDVTVTSSDVPGVGVTFTATANPDVPATLQVAAGDAQLDLYGRELSTPLAVLAHDQYGNPTPGGRVTWQVLAGGGTITLIDALTDALGIARASYRLGLTPGQNGVRASLSAGGGSVDVDFSEQALGFAKQIAVGTFHSCALDENGTAYCWGKNSAGELGDGSNTTRVTPGRVSGQLVFTQLSSALDVTCGLAAGGAVYCWGSNAYGALGDGTQTNRNAPTPVSGPLRFTDLSTGAHVTCGVATSGAAYCWGAEDSGQLGAGSATYQSCTSTSGGPDFACNRAPLAVAGGLTVASIAAGPDHVCARTSAGALHCWGRGENYGHVAGIAIDSVPVPIATTLAFTAVSAGNSHTCGLVAPNSAYCWGRETFGVIGNGTSSGVQETPALVTGVSALQVVAGGWTSCASTAGSASCWGFNNYGAVGDGTMTSPITTPTTVSGGLTFDRVVTSGYHSCGHVANGQVYCWGGNGYGELGTSGAHPTPALVRP